MSITPVDPSDQITLPTDRQPGDLIESQDINQIAQAVNHLSSGSGIGEIDHRDLTNRDAANQHPIGAITDLQSELNGKAEADHTHTAAQISDATTTGRVLMQATSAIAARASIAAAASNHTHDGRYYTEDEVDDALDDKANATHQHPVTDLETTGTPDETTYLRGDGAWATPAGGGAFFPYPPITAGSGNWWAGPARSGSSGSSSTGQVHYVPLLIGRPVRIVGFKIDVATAAPSGTIHVGLYGTVDGTDMRGAPLIATLLTAVDASTTGEKIATGLTVDLDPGLHWLGYHYLGDASTTIVYSGSTDPLSGLLIPHRAAGNTRVGGMKNGTSPSLPDPAVMQDTWDTGQAPPWYALQTAVIPNTEGRT